MYLMNFILKENGIRIFIAQQNNTLYIFLKNIKLSIYHL